LWPPGALWEVRFERIHIDDVPLLVEAVMSLENNNILALSITVSCYIESSSIFDVHQSTFIILKELEPSGVGYPKLEVM
jgi:hypothetical protein